jgi:hypothetical protein
MVDLEVLAAELLVVEESLGCSHEGFLTDRLSRVGVARWEVENFSAWRHTVSRLTGSNSREDEHLAQIAAAGEAGLVLFDGIIEYLKALKQQTSLSNAQIKALAA